MKGGVQFFGILALVTLIFGLVSVGIIENDQFFTAEINLTLAAFSALIFLGRGGLGVLRSATAKRRAGYGAGVTLYSVLFLAVLVLANYLAAKNELFRYDSTEEKVFTLAPQTSVLLGKLEQPLRIRAFYIGGRIEPKLKTLLERISQASELVSWQLIDTEKNPLLVKQFKIQTSGTLHLSYELESGARETVIARDLDEQSIANALLKLTRSAQKKVYYLVGHGEPSLEDLSKSGFSSLGEAIKGESLSLAPLALGNRGLVPEDGAAVIIAAPQRELLDAERLAIENYLKKGGGLVILSEPNTVPDIAELVLPLGIVVGNDVIIDQIVRADSAASMGVQPMISQYGEHPITENFEKGTVFGIAGSVRASKDSPQGAQLTELAFSSKSSWAEKNLELLFGEEPRAALEPDDIEGPVSLAATFEGVLEEGTKSARVVVIGDADFVSNANIRQLYNRDFFLNALNWSIGEGELIAIRAKTIRQSTVLLSAEQFNAIFVLAAIVLPELTLLSGLFIWWRRRR